VGYGVGVVGLAVAGNVVSFWASDCWRWFIGWLGVLDGRGCLVMAAWVLWGAAQLSLFSWVSVLFGDGLVWI